MNCFLLQLVRIFCVLFFQLPYRLAFALNFFFTCFFYRQGKRRKQGRTSQLPLAFLAAPVLSIPRRGIFILLTSFHVFGLTCFLHDFPSHVPYLAPVSVPAPHQGDASLRQLVSAPPRLHFEPPSLHCEGFRASKVSFFEPPHLLNLDFDADTRTGLTSLWIRIRIFTLMRIWRHRREKVSKLFG